LNMSAFPGRARKLRLANGSPCRARVTMLRSLWLVKRQFASHSEGQFDGTAYGAKAQPSNDVGKHSAGQKREWAGQGNCSSFGPFPPDFRIRVAPMEPITREEPVGQ
jgi:hypothetical protein